MNEADPSINQSMEGMISKSFILLCEQSKVQKTVYSALPLMKKKGVNDKYIYDYTFADYFYKEIKTGNSICF